MDYELKSKQNPLIAEALGITLGGVKETHF
jgi:hypothetical protein